MKDLLSKEHHCYKIHTLKSSAFPSSIENPPIWTTLHFSKKILIPLQWLFKNFNTLLPINVGSVYTMLYVCLLMIQIHIFGKEAL